MYYYSATTGGFYDTSFAKYDLPDDRIELTFSEYSKLHKDTLKGLAIKLVDGALESVEPEISEDKLIKIELDWVESEITRSGLELDKVQDGDSAAVGTVTAWRTYRKALRSWHSDSNFPNKYQRPVSPDA